MSTAREPHPVSGFRQMRARFGADQVRRVVGVSLLALGFGGSTLALLAADSADRPPRLRRADSFLGIHFDFHAGEDSTEIGRRTTPATVANILEQVRPDYIQIDSKGHRGLSSYPTEVGHPAPGFVGDPLRIWRDVTAEYGVALYLHYSGVWDAEAVRRHPDWARVNAEGKPDDRLASVFGPYADRLLIPQLKELSDRYEVDGVWVDGECWAVAPDYRDDALKAFQAATGLAEAPRQFGEPHWFEFAEFNREAFRQYVRHYVDSLHRHNPDFQLTSNWAFSGHMPEPVTIDLDFLSGDYALQDSVNSARFSARCLAGQGKPWDLMAWAFSGKQSEPGRSLKTIVQLQQEAAVVLAQGGGFQAYFKQERDGSIHDWQMKLMSEVAKFCRARQAFCHRSTPVPQIALVYSRAAHYRESRALFHPSGRGVDSLKGLLQGLLDGQSAVDIRSEHQLAGRLDRYPLVVLPDWDYLDPAFKTNLVTYVERGGSLVLAGPRVSRLFLEHLDVAIIGEPKPGTVRYLDQDGWLGAVRGSAPHLVLGPAARRFGNLYVEDDPRGASEPATVIARLGRGWIAATWLDLGEDYLTRRTAVTRDFLQSLAREMFPHPMVEVIGSHHVEVVPARNDGRLLIHLINTSGPHADRSVHTFDEIPALGPLQVLIHTGFRPRRIKVEPDGEQLLFQYRDGRAQVILASLPIYSILVIE